MSLVFHANPHAFACKGNNSQMIATSNSVNNGDYVTKTSKLNNKSSIKKLYLLMCNAGHRFHSKDNLAQAFQSKVGDVLSCDGTIKIHNYLGEILSELQHTSCRGILEILYL